MKKLLCLLIVLCLLPVAALGENWNCPSCGNTDNSGKFCPECGQPKPVPESWTCVCGTTDLTGNFCTECGLPRPTAVPAADAAEETAGGKWACALCCNEQNPAEVEQCVSCGADKGVVPDTMQVENDVLLSYSGEDALVVVPWGVTVIGNSALSGIAFERVILPETLKEIGDEAFTWNYMLTELHIPANVEHISSGILCWCNQLANITVDPANPYYTARDGVLYDLRNDELVFCVPAREGKTFTVDEGVRKIGAYAFANSQLEELILPSTLTEIGEHGLAYLLNVTRLEIPEGVTRIGAFAMSGCDRLETVVLPASVERIGNGVFAWSDSIRSVIIAADQPRYRMDNDFLIGYGEVLRMIPTAGITEVTFPENATCIGSYCIENAEDMKHLTVPGTVAELYDTIASSCKHLSVLTLEEGVTSIYGYAVWQCERLQYIDVPASLLYIDEKLLDNLRPSIIFRGPEGTYAQQFCQEHGKTYQVTDN